jgi:hypothetical protein
MKGSLTTTSHYNMTDKSRDDTSQAENIGYLLLFCIYILGLSLASYKLYKYRRQASVLRTISVMAVLFFSCNLHVVRSVYWADPLLDLPIVVYNLLEIIPNILLYIIGQIIAYLW